MRLRGLVHSLTDLLIVQATISRQVSSEMLLLVSGPVGKPSVKVPGLLAAREPSANPPHSPAYCKKRRTPDLPWLPC